MKQQATMMMSMLMPMRMCRMAIFVALSNKR